MKRKRPDDGKTTRTRAAACRKGWESRRRMAAVRAALAGGPPAPAPEWGSKPLPAMDTSIPGILARIKAREGAA